MLLLTILRMLTIAAAVQDLHCTLLAPHAGPFCPLYSDPNYRFGVVMNCSFKMLNAVPSSLPPNTTTLLLSYNSLLSLHDNVFNHVPDLRELDLSINSISVLEPQAFAGLSQLVKLSLRGNNLTLSLHDNVFNHVPDLRELDLSINSISVLEPQAFAGLSQLVKLSLRGNNLALSPQTYSDDVFTPLQSLQFLDISCNTNNSEDTHKCRQIASPDHTQKACSKVNEELQDPEIVVFRQRGIEMQPDIRQTSRGSTSGRKISHHSASFGYPDRALSVLTKLCSLSMDGPYGLVLGEGFRNLTTLRHLDLNGKTGICNIDTLFPEMFTNVNLTHLNLSDCDITQVDRQTFKTLPNLNQLDVSYNRGLGLFDLEQFKNVLYSLAHHTKIQRLLVDGLVDARALGLDLQAKHLTYFKELHYLQHLSARFNRIESVDEGVLCSRMPPNLKHLRLDGNLLELAPYVNDLHCLRSLTDLHMDGLSGIRTPVFKPPPTNASASHDVRHSSAVSLLATGDTVYHDDDDDQEFSVPPLLTTFTARNFGLAYKLHEVRVNANNSLTEIDLRQNYLPVWRGPLSGFHSVKRLYLMQSQAADLNCDFFPSFPALEILNISGNNLRDAFASDMKGGLLRNLTNLRVLDASMNDLETIYSKTLEALFNLEELYLSDNAVEAFNISINNMSKIQFLDLHRNMLQRLPQDVMQHLDVVASKYNVSIDLSRNPLACDCGNLDFLRWFRQNQRYFVNTDHYGCDRDDVFVIGTSRILEALGNLERECVDQTKMIIGITASVVFVVSVFLMAVFYRHRWKLRYLYYASRLALQRRTEYQQIFDYDAFVSFALDDDDFVMGELRQQLEDNLGLKLCIHTRDFIPGRFITSNIVDSIQRSRRTLIVLTSGLVASDWCQFELQMALVEAAHTGRDVLVFLLYEHVPLQQMSRDILANLHANTYAEFPHGETNRDPYWRQLASSLRE